MRGIWVGILASTLVLGCSWSPRPYARDPLVRHGFAEHTDPGAARMPTPEPDPQPPLPPLLTPDESQHVSR